MFEYLMPVLWMRTYPNTLLDNSRIAAVRLQQIYATEKGVPWGISESAYAKRDEAGNYQYQAFGLPRYFTAHRRTGSCWSFRRIPLSSRCTLIPRLPCATCAAWQATAGWALRVLRVGRLFLCRPPHLAPSP